MNMDDEHDDDLEPEVIEGEVETEQYPDDEDLERSQPGNDVTNPASRADEERESAIDRPEEKGDASDTI